MRPCRLRRCTPSLLLVAVAAMLLLPDAARAHSDLLRSTPADGEQLERPPGQLRLEFSGRVTAGRDSVMVFAPDEERVDEGAARPRAGATIFQDLDAGEQGIYGVAYRVTSDDGHVISGALTFIVGEAGNDAAAGGAAAAEESARENRALDTAFAAVRFVEILAVLVAAGSGLFVCLFAPGWRPPLLVGALCVLLASYAAAFLLHGVDVRGTDIADALDPQTLRAASESPFGRSLEIRGIVAAVALGPAFLLRSSAELAAPARVALALVFTGVAASVSFSGHAVGSDQTAIRLPLDMLHVVAASLWLGGLVQLALLAPHAAAWLPAIRTFSHAAFAAVVAILVTGAGAALMELDLDPGHVLDMTYGRLIAAKLLLYAATLPLAWSNMTAFAPGVETRGIEATRMLRQYVLRELFLLVAIVALTAWLVTTPQPTG